MSRPAGYGFRTPDGMEGKDAWMLKLPLWSVLIILAAIGKRNES